RGRPRPGRGARRRRLPGFRGDRSRRRGGSRASHLPGRIAGLSLEVIIMRPARSLPLLILCITAAGLAADSPPESLLGFSPARVAGQRSLEQRFDAALDPAELKEWMRRLSARP